MSQVERGKPAKVEGGNRTNKLSASPDRVNETRVNGKERLGLATTFWEIYNENVIDRKVLCDHIYGILLALMQNPVLMESPGDRFSVDQEGRVRFTINLSPNKPNPTLARFPVETNADFKANLQLRTNLENLERQKFMVKQKHYELAVREILPILQSLDEKSSVRTAFLETFNNVNTDLEQELRKIREREVKREEAELAIEIGNWLLNLLDKIEQRNSV